MGYQYFYKSTLILAKIRNNTEISVLPFPYLVTLIPLSCYSHSPILGMYKALKP